MLLRLLTVHVLLALVGAAPELWGAGGAALFDGVDDHVRFEAGGCGGNVFSSEELTMSVWFLVNTESHVARDRGDWHLIGAPGETGVRLFLSSNPQIGMRGLAIFPRGRLDGFVCDEAVNAAAINATGMPLLPSSTLFNVLDGRWHHMAIGSGRSVWWASVDGQLVEYCSNPNPAVFRVQPNGPYMHIGAYDLNEQANANVFPGWLDDVRVYARYFDPAVFWQAAHRRPASPTDTQDLVLWLNFDNETAPFDDASPNRTPRESNWLRRNRPRIEPSSAPITGPQLQVRGRKRPAPSGALTANSSEAAADMTVLVDGRDLPLGNLSLHFEAVSLANPAALTLIDASGAQFTPSAGTSVSGTRFVVRPAVGAIGDVMLQATVRVGNDTVNSSTLELRVGVRDNAGPTSGGAGFAASCDGEDDYLYNKDFEWPVRFFDATNQTGGAPVTVEWWGWVDETAAKDSALFTIGSAEMDMDWVNNFSPYRRHGRFVVRAPGAGHEFVLNLGGAAVASPAAPLSSYYRAWNHFAITSDQAAGSAHSLYINGELVASSTMAGAAVGMNPLFRPVKGFYVCSWSFWSEVYHRGLVDELRVWDVARSAAEIRRDMWATLAGDEPHLVGYWTFDEQDDSGGGGVVREARDSSPYARHLEGGGCAPCEEYYKGWMAYRPDLGVFPPANASERDPLGNGYRVCLPSAKSEQSPKFVQANVFGGQHCYDGNTDAGARPARIVSTAPFGGHVFEQTAHSGEWLRVLLNGTDPDGDATRFEVREAPTRGTLAYSLDNGASYVTLTSGDTLPVAVRTVYFASAAGGGGEMYARLVYSLTDGLMRGPNRTVQLHVTCPAGSAANTSTMTCEACPPGRFAATKSTAAQCTACPTNTYQPLAGRTSCARCDEGRSFAPSGSPTCTPCSALEALRGAAALAVDGTGCERSVAMAPEDALVVSFLQSNATPTTGGGSMVQLPFVRSVPLYGALFQVREEAGTGRLVPGDNLLVAFSSGRLASRQFASNASSTAAAAVGHPLEALLGEPDVLRYGSSSGAWSPLPSRSGGGEELLVRVSEAVVVQSVVVYQSRNPGAVVEIAAMDEETGAAHIMWTGAARRADHTLVAFEPELCPAFFRTRTVRLRLEASKMGGPVEIDAVAVVGVASVASLPLAYVTDPRGRALYVPANARESFGAYVESVSYGLRDCRGSAPMAAGTLTLQVELAPPVVRIPLAMGAALAALATLGLVLALATLAATYRLRDSAVLRATSVPFCLATALAVGAYFLRALLFNLEELSPGAVSEPCATDAVLQGIGFTWLFGSLLLKSYRLDRIFNATKVTVVKISNRALLRAVFSMWLVNAAIIAMQAAVAPLRRELVVVNGTTRIYSCVGEDSNWFSAAHWASQGALALAVVFYCVRTHRVPTAFNESKAIAFVSYNAALTALVTIGLGAALRGNLAAAVAVRNIGDLCVGFVTLGALFAPKFALIASGLDGTQDTSAAMATASRTSVRLAQSGTASVTGSASAALTISTTALPPLQPRRTTLAVSVTPVVPGDAPQVNAS
jgi:hypothetical protein